MQYAIGKVHVICAFTTCDHTKCSILVTSTVHVWSQKILSIYFVKVTQLKASSQLKSYSNDCNYPSVTSRVLIRLVRFNVMQYRNHWSQLPLNMLDQFYPDNTSNQSRCIRKQKFMKEWILYVGHVFNYEERCRARYRRFLKVCSLKQIGCIHYLNVVCSVISSF